MSGNPNADSKFVWMNGTLVPYEAAQIHVLSHSLHYGCGVFEGIRAYKTSNGGTAIFRAEEHYKRFEESIRVMGYSTPYNVESWMAATVDLIHKNGFQECYIRPLAYIDDSIRGLKLPIKPEVQCAIAVWTWGKYMGDEGQKKGIRCKVSTFRRADVSTSLSLAKLTGGYLTSVLARQEATLDGYDEAILLDPQGFVAEGSGENIFIVKNGKISTPPDGFILPGITRSSAIELARHLGIEVVEERIARNQLYLADEVFFTGTAVEITPIREIDHKTIGSGGPGKITLKLLEHFFKAARGDAPEFKKWLTPV